MLIIRNNGESKKVLLDGNDITDKCIKCTCYMYDRKGLPITELLVEDTLFLESTDDIAFIEETKFPEEKSRDRGKVFWLAITISVMQYATRPMIRPFFMTMVVTHCWRQV